MSNIAIEILIILLLIMANGLLAMSEAAIISARKARLERLSDEGHAGAKVALELARNPTHFLSTTQIGITLVGILAGAFGGATVAEEVAHGLDEIDALAPYSNGIGLVLVVVTITFLSLILGELVPKRLALNSPEKIASLVAAPMNILSKLTAPVVAVISFTTDVSLRALGVKPSIEPPVTEDEIRILIEHGTQAGVFDEAEQDMVDSILSLDQTRVKELMTPRTKVIWLDVDASIEENREKMANSGFSYYPVYQDSPDNVIGIASVKDMWAKAVKGEKLELKECLRKPTFVPETVFALKMLDIFQESGEHIALVLSEYGGVEGIVTLIDIIEAIVGDLPSLSEIAEAQPFQREDGSWLLDGLLSIDEVKEMFDLEADLPGEENNTFSTLGGFLVMNLERIPKAGDYLEAAGLRFEVMDMDGNRVDKLLITKIPEKAEKTKSSDD
ncbi:MAG: HlyC/CorC family transporter [Chloroflexi bacterium]|nr:HlyC/CorC family transporter [Chloroflexota bacterium]